MARAHQVITASHCPALTWRASCCLAVVFLMHRGTIQTFKHQLGFIGHGVSRLRWGASLVDRKISSWSFESAGFWLKTFHRFRFRLIHWRSIIILAWYHRPKVSLSCSKMISVLATWEALNLVSKEPNVVRADGLQNFSDHHLGFTDVSNTQQL